MNKIIDLLNKEKEKSYKDFIARLTPSVEPENMLGVRVPKIRIILKQLTKEECDEFIKELPHKYYEENLLHGFIISKSKDYQTAVDRLNAFLPYVDNWAVSDTMGPKVLSKRRDLLIIEIEKWIKDKHTYTVRFAIWCLMRFFLKEYFDYKCIKMVVDVSSNGYYINVMRAWYFAEALTTNYDETLPFIKSKSLDKWTHNKSIQKACESRRITENCKDYLRELKV